MSSLCPPHSRLVLLFIQPLLLDIVPISSAWATEQIDGNSGNTLHYFIIPFTNSPSVYVTKSPDYYLHSQSDSCCVSTLMAYLAVQFASFTAIGVIFMAI